MSAFAIPIPLCEELQRMMNSFWWCSKGRDRNVFIGFLETRCVWGKNMVAWGFGTSIILIWQYWDSRFGEFFLTQMLFLVELSKLNISLKGTCCMRQKDLIRVCFGKTYCNFRDYYKKESNGEWGMELILKCGAAGGS